ncbi:hypothetical protein M422DRAFT_243518 [Sphaerobolus stellatus SS14]|nr:hypothetical protein M422DRAFT_243518 [Sphaerobolus stellatus SS14]
MVKPRTNGNEELSLSFDPTGSILHLRVNVNLNLWDFFISYAWFNAIRCGLCVGLAIRSQSNNALAIDFLVNLGKCCLSISEHIPTVDLLNYASSVGATGLPSASDAMVSPIGKTNFAQVLHTNVGNMIQRANMGVAGQRWINIEVDLCR